MIDIYNYTTILFLLGALIVLTNLIVQVIKPLTQIKIPTEITAMVVAEVLTLIAYFGYAECVGWPIHWYSIAATVIAGLLVSYGAQFGFDKLKDALESIKKLKGSE